MIGLALAILRASDLHENSYDEKVKAYRLGKKQAAHLAAHNKPELEKIVYILLLAAWNDSIAWAEEVKREHLRHKMSIARPRSRLYVKAKNYPM